MKCASAEMNRNPKSVAGFGGGRPIIAVRSPSLLPPSTKRIIIIIVGIIIIIIIIIIMPT